MRTLVNIITAKLHPRLLTKGKLVGKPLKPLPGVCSTERRAKSAALDAQGKNDLLEHLGCTGRSFSPGSYWHAYCTQDSLLRAEAWISTAGVNSTVREVTTGIQATTIRETTRQTSTVRVNSTARWVTTAIHAMMIGQTSTVQVNSTARGST